MNANDLLGMLDLDGRDATPRKSRATITEIKPSKGKPSTGSPTALRLDQWGMRRGADVLASNATIKTALSKARNPEDAAADFFGAAFEPDPQFNESCEDATRGEFIRQLLDTPECQALRTSTVLDNVAAEVAAESFATSYGALVASKSDPTDIDVLRGVGSAIDEAQAEVDALGDATSACGMGGGPSSQPRDLDPKAVAALYRRIRSNPELRRIIDAAGRYRRVAQSKQRQKVAHGYDDVTGVTLDADLGRLLPHELAKLSIPEFEDDVLRRFVERQTMCREHSSVEPIGKGPIIVCVDESGSMHGPKVEQAKAIALAMAWVARSQRRWCGLVAYSGDTGERLLTLAPGRWDETALVDWLEGFIDGGSNLDVPVREMPDYWTRFGPPRDRTDVIFITDAICSIPRKIQADFLAWKTSVKARLTTLVIRSHPGDLVGISDELHEVPSLDVSQGGVESVLSI